MFLALDVGATQVMVIQSTIHKNILGELEVRKFGKYGNAGWYYGTLGYSFQAGKKKG